MKDVFRVLIPVGVVFVIFGWIGYALSGWLFWAVVLGIPALTLGGLQLAYQVDIRLIWMMNDNGKYEEEKGLLWAIARKIRRQLPKGDDL